MVIPLRPAYLSALMVLICSPAALPMAAAQTAGGPDQSRALLTTYCATCHNTKLKTGGIAFDAMDLQDAADDAQTWEKALRKLRGHLMPPPGAIRSRRKKTWIRSLPGWRTRSIPIPKVLRRAMCQSNA